MENDDITRIFIDILEQSRSVDIAEAEFKRQMADDDELHQRYRDWCHEVGSTERHGFLDFCEQYIEEQSSIWDVLSDDFEEP